MEQEKVFRGRVVSIDKTNRTVVVKPQKKENGQWIDDPDKEQVTRKY